MPPADQVPALLGHRDQHRRPAAGTSRPRLPRRPASDPLRPGGHGRNRDIWSTAADLARFTTGYGYGMFTGTFAGQAAYYHPGDNPGYQSFSGWLPDLAVSLVVLANDESLSMTDLLRQLLPAALDG